MNIREFLESKEIVPEELEVNFEFVRRIDIDMIGHESCPNCNDVLNYRRYPSSSWTYVHRCIACGTIMITFVADRMGGGYLDTVDVYKDKKGK